MDSSRRGTRLASEPQVFAVESEIGTFDAPRQPLRSNSCAPIKGAREHQDPGMVQQYIHGLGRTDTRDLHAAGRQAAYGPRTSVDVRYSPPLFFGGPCLSKC